MCIVCVHIGIMMTQYAASLAWRHNSNKYKKLWCRASKILRSRVWPFGVTWRHRSRGHWTRHLWFSIGGPLEPCIYLAPFWRYKASKLHLPMLKAKSSLCMLHVTWPVGRGVQNDHIFGIPEAILSIQYTTFMGLRWRLGAVLSKPSRVKIRRVVWPVGWSTKKVYIH